MSTEQAKKQVLEDYIAAFNRNDLEAIVALYAEDATVEDPYGTPAQHGLAAIRAFYQNALKMGATLSLDAPIRASMGDAAAMAFTARAEVDGKSFEIKVIDVMTFNAQGKIQSMRAYFGQSDMLVS